MGTRNYLIEGVSGTGKTSVCNELQRRGYHAIQGDRELAYQGDQEIVDPTDGFAHEHNIWHVDKVKALVANQDEVVTFFCGGSRNFAKFIDLFDGVFVLEVDLDTLNRRLTSDRTLSGAAESHRNGNSLRDCIRRKKTFRRMAFQSTPPHRSRASLTKSFVKAKRINECKYSRSSPRPVLADG
jgi:shikimate kinase